MRADFLDENYLDGEAQTICLRTTEIGSFFIRFSSAKKYIKKLY